MAPSLCESCANMREVRTARSRFLLCELSTSDPAFAKYPRQPVVVCSGYEPKPEPDPAPPDDQLPEA